MTDFQKLVGPKANKITVGRFYHVIDADGEHVIAQASADSFGVVVATVKPLSGSGVYSYRNGTSISFIDGTGLGRNVYKFTQVPDTVRYRGKQVTSQAQLTVGRWYILIDRDGTEYSGQYATRQNGPCILFTLDDESLSRRRHSGRFAVNLDGTSLRKVYKFTQVPKAKPKPVVEIAAGFPYGTRSKDIGAKVGDKFQFVDIPDDRRDDITLGTVFTLSTDDYSRCPWFKDADGKEYCLHWERLTHYTAPVATHEPATEPDEGADDHPPMHCYPRGTTSRRIGAKIGDKFIFVDNGEHHTPWTELKLSSPLIGRGQLVTLVDDDGSDCPYFTWDGAKGNAPIFFSRLAPYAPAPATEPEPAPAQEAANDDWADALTQLPEPVISKAKEALDLQRAARAIGLLANEVQKRYEVAQEAVKAHTVAVQALENAQRDLIELAKKATAHETI